MDIGEFSGLRTEYEGVPAADATETTVEAVAVQDDATIVIAPDDADSNSRNGHQVSLDGSEITVTVTSEDGSRTRVYRVQLGDEEDGQPASEEQEPAAVAEPAGECLRDLTPARFSLVIYEGGSIADLKDCAVLNDLMAMWDYPDRDWVPLILGAPAFANHRFEDLYPEGLPSPTPLVAQRDLPRNFPARDEGPEPIEDAQPQIEAPPQAETPSEVATEPDEESVPAIGNTGGDGVSHRYDCDDAARVSWIGGWSDATEIEVLGEGRGRCAGWLLAEAENVTSWGARAVRGRVHRYRGGSGAAALAGNR